MATTRGNQDLTGIPQTAFEIEAISTVLGMAKGSACQRGQVGCLLYDANHKLMSVAFNDNVTFETCERPDEQGNCGCVHAEIRALAVSSLRFSRYQSAPGTPYLAVISRAPCVLCSKALIWAGVREVWFVEESWPWPDAAPLWAKIDAKVRQIKPRDVPPA